MRRRILIALILGLLATLALGVIGAQTATRTVADGYARDPDGQFVATWQVDVRTNAMHRRLRYWRMQISGMNLMMSSADYEQGRIDLDPYPGHLKPDALADLEIYALYGEAGWPFPALAYKVDQTWQGGGPTWKAHATYVLGDTPNGNARMIPMRPVMTGLILDTLIFAAIVFAILEGAAWLIRTRRTRAGHCRACNYDLSGGADTCPECGAPIATPPACG